ncbi:MAG: ABC transporter permease [Aliidongia sp.]
MPRFSAPLRFLQRIAADPAGLFGLVVAVLFTIVALLSNEISPYDPAHIAVIHRLEGPSRAHLLGTDQLGRDTLSRILVGSRTALGVSVVSILLAATIGAPLGLLAGYGPRWFGTVLLLLLDIVNSLPMIMFALALLVLVGPGFWTVVGVIAFFSVPGYARLIRAQTLSLGQSGFILAARAMGAGLGRILFVHLLPNAMGALLVVVTMDIPSVIGLEAGLSFLGIGIQPPTPSWGSILNDGFSFIRNTPDLVIFAGLPLVATTIGFTFLGERLRQILQPKAAP